MAGNSRSLVTTRGRSLKSKQLMTREKSVETFMRQQEAVQTQFARMVSSSPLGAMSELTRQNLELWTKMQESMLVAFAPPRDQTPQQEDKDEKEGARP